MDCKVARNLLLISFGAETFFATYGLLLGAETSFASILYFIAGLGLVFSILFLPEARFDRYGKSAVGGLWIKCGLAIIMLFLAYITSRYWLDQIPVDPDYADMLPIIKVMNERFLSGHWKQVYDPVSEIWNGAHPIYLPAMWFPYSGALLLNLDMRWITVIAILLSFTGFLFILRIRKNAIYSYLLPVIAGMLFWWIFSKDDVHGLISLSEEGPVILYFVLLCFGIISGNIYFIGIAASLCLLSRYSMIGWLIPFLLFLFWHKQYKKAIIFSVTIILFFLLFFLIPFGVAPAKQLIHLPSAYINFASRVWRDTPEVFWLNPGFAKFFGPHGTATLYKTLVLGSFVLPVLLMVFCLLQKKWRLNNLNLAAFKLSLIVFYQFIDVPYGYLFYTSSFVSLIIAGIICSQQNKEKENQNSPAASI
jgi:hypothetical protein